MWPGSLFTHHGHELCSPSDVAVWPTRATACCQTAPSLLFLCVFSSRYMYMYLTLISHPHSPTNLCSALCSDSDGESDTSITAAEVEAELRRMIEEVSGNSHDGAPLASLFPRSEPSARKTRWDLPTARTIDTTSKVCVGVGVGVFGCGVGGVTVPVRTCLSQEPGSNSCPYQLT